MPMIPRFFRIVILLSGWVLSVYGQDNYVTESTVRIPLKESELDLASTDVAATVVAQNIRYFDDIGRLVQMVGKRASASSGPQAKSHDVIAFMEYDDMGRQPIKYLPYTESTGTVGSFRPAAKTNQLYYFQNPDPGQHMASNSVPYATSIYEASPLNRVLDQGSEGREWYPGRGHSTTMRTRATGFDPDDESEVVSDRIIYWMIGNESSGLIYNNGYYKGGELAVQDVKDINGVHNRIYTDRTGRTIAINRIDPLTGTMAKSYFIYDAFGRLRYSIPPLSDVGVEFPNTLAHGDAMVRKYFFSYTYDQRGRLVEMRKPGAQPEYFVYDRLDRLAARQDGNLRVSKTGVYPGWYIYKYDVLGRQAQEMIVRFSRTVSQAQMVSFYSGVPSMYETRNLDVYTSTINLATLQIPIVSTDVLKTYYYDDYYFRADGTPHLYDASAPDAPVYGQEDVQDYAIGRLTGIVTRVKSSVNTSSDVDKATVVFYDDNGREVQVRSSNHKRPSLTVLGDVTSVIYHQTSGQVLNVTMVHSAQSNYQITVAQRYEYDQLDRVAATYQKNALNGVYDTEVQTASFEYNELGQLLTQNLHVKGDAFPNQSLQSVDYRYHQKGWTTQINENGPAPDDNNSDLFNMQLYYDNGTDKRYDGQVSSMVWQASNDANPAPDQRAIRMYDFGYDFQNMLTHASYSIYNNSKGKFEQEYWQGASVASYNETATYYLHGGIKRLTRTGRGSVTDDLAFASNADGSATGLDGFMLKYVKDLSGNIQGYANKSAIATVYDQYTYDNNGNMTNDPGNGIAAISYNHHNLPIYINIKGRNDGKGVYIDYDGDGNKTRMTHIPATGSQRVTDYVDGFVYEDNVLEYFTFGMGRIVPTGATAAGADKFRYEYFLTDHLGSVRVAFTDVDNDGVPETTQENHYYPFGSTLSQWSSSAGGGVNNYLFNGKEKSGLVPYHDYGARNYNAILGRWLQEDPMNQFAHPYSYVGNNPVNMVDPTGMWGEDSNIPLSGNPEIDNARIREYQQNVLGNDYYDSRGRGVGDMSYGFNAAWNRSSFYNKATGSNKSTGDFLSAGFSISSGGGGRPSGKRGGGSPNQTVIPNKVKDASGKSLNGTSPKSGKETKGGATTQAAIPIAAAIAAADGPSPILDAVAVIVLAGAITYDESQRTYVTYTLTNPTTGQKYAGRASGFGTPEQVMMSRYASHHMKALGYGNPVLDRAAQGLDAYFAIRGREQQLIDFYGGVGSPMVGNAIRGVGYYNLEGPLLHNASNMYFGPLHNYTGAWK